MPRACVITYGCQMNVHDSEIASGQLKRLGYELVDDESRADAIFVNTCTVREHAKMKGLSRLSSLAAVKRRRPDVFIAAMGCVASEERENLRATLPFLDAIIPTDQVTQISKFLSDRAEDFPSAPAADSITADTPRLRFSAFKSYVTIITGCNMDCTYCIVPRTRGREKSRPIEDVLREVASLVEQGYREIMFLGQTVNAYGDDLGDTRATFAELLRRTDALFPNGRVRFLSPHPKKVTADLIESWPRLSSLCEHIHLPVQSGSDRMLRRMKRLYTRSEFESTADALRRTVPGISITTDLIVGFPGETEEDFLETLSLCESAAFDAAYLYIYSPRQDTAATRLRDPVPAHEISVERHTRLAEIQLKNTIASLERQIGRTAEVLFEDKAREGGLFGKTRTNHDVVMDLPAHRIGHVATVRISARVGTSLRGEVEEAVQA